MATPTTTSMLYSMTMRTHHGPQGRTTNKSFVMSVPLFPPYSEGKGTYVSQFLDMPICQWALTTLQIETFFTISVLSFVCSTITKIVLGIVFIRMGFVAPSVTTYTGIYLISNVGNLKTPNNSIWLGLNPAYRIYTVDSGYEGASYRYSLEYMKNSE